MKKNIVIIEDEVDIRDALIHLFEKNEFKVYPYNSGEEYFSDTHRPELCVHLVDWNLPGIKGPEIIRCIRTSDTISSIFMMTAFNSNEQTIEGLKCGADDYITKPFNYDELLARARNAQTKLSSLKGSLLTKGLHLIPEAHSVIKNGVIVGLTAREFMILDYLYKNERKVISRAEIIEQFGAGNEMTSRNIDVHVFSLRKKIKPIKLEVATVWGTGYKLVVEG